MQWQAFIPKYLFTAKKIGLAGFGAEGKSTLEWLQKWLPASQLLVVDQQPITDKNLTTNSSIEILDNAADFESLTQCDLVFRSPGIHPRLIPSNIKTTSNAQILLEILRAANQTLSPNSRKWHQHRFPVLGVTGTKGKTTTSSFLHHLLKTAGFSSLLGGNIGTPPLQLLNEVATGDAQTFFCLELSSHQLQDMTISPNLGILQMMATEHLDYFANKQEYFAAKEAICKYQTAQDTILYFDSAPSNKIAQLGDGTKRAFKQTGQLNYHNQDLTLDNSKIIGLHMMVNIVPSLLVAKDLEIDAATIQAAIDSYQPVAHRLEKVGTWQSTQFFNDSAATTPESSLAALQAFRDKRIVLIAGGSSKGSSFKELASQIDQPNIIQVLLFPPEGEKILALLHNTHKASLATSMPDAFAQIKWQLQPEIVLLSPACASFGMFKNYQDRGQQFKDLATQVIEQ